MARKAKKPRKPKAPKVRLPAVRRVIVKAHTVGTFDRKFDRGELTDRDPSTGVFVKRGSLQVPLFGSERYIARLGRTKR